MKLPPSSPSLAPPKRALALMPDYNRKATTYWWQVVLAGPATVLGSLHLEGGLRPAIDKGRLTVAYQPMCELCRGRTGHVTGFGALVRWHHPADGSIRPAEFLPIAEEAGQMLRLTDFVMPCLMSRLEDALPVLRELQRLGARLAIDDFGIGLGPYQSPGHPRQEALFH